MANSHDTSDRTRQPGSARPATKRGKPSDKQDGGEQGRKRARGRPRLDMDPATVADRRRTQLRVAQRAYRDRKEGTLSTLEKKVQNLEKQRQSMNSGLTQFYDAFLARGLDTLAPDLTIELKALVEQSATANERDRSESSGVETQDSSSTQEQPAILEGVQEALQPATSSGSIVNRESSLDSSSPESQGRVARMPASSAYVSQGIPETGGYSTYKSDPFAPLPMFIDCVGWTASYAFREKTFGRRMQRAALEAAAEMCHQPFPDPDCYTAVFGFCLLWESKDEIRTRILRLVQRPASETLDDWSFPFAHLGDTGHLSATVQLEKVPNGMPGQEGYLPIGNFETSDDPANKDIFQGKPFMGPFSSRVESARDSYLDQQMHMLFPDFEGSFYDPNDTELYLRLRGIVIPEQVDFVTAEINLDDFSSSDGLDNDSAIPVTHGCSNESVKSTDDWKMARLDAGGPSNLQALLPDSFLSRVDWAGASGDSSMFPEPNEIPTALDLNDLTGVKTDAFRGRKVTVSIDVNRLVSEVVQRTVCLGRCPGIRPKHINQAVRLAATLQT